jgi:exodeoxyribonuclease VII small subunit
MTEKTKFNFSKGYKELEELVADFEAREIDLEKDLPKFERGLELAQKLQQRMREIENKVIDIDKKFSDHDDEDDE